MRVLLPRARADDGQAMVEFTIILIPVLLLVFGIAYFGLALNNWIDETHLASAAARFYAVNQNPGGENLSGWVKTHADTATLKEATATICSPTSQVGDYVEVKITYPQKWLPILGVGPESQITSTAQMRIEVAPEKPYPSAC